MAREPRSTPFLALLLTSLFVVVVLLLLPAGTHGWGTDGHYIVCRIAEGRLTEAAAEAANKLLPDYAAGNLSSLCSWADRIKFRYHWTSPLHYIDTPDGLCNYTYARDCKNEDGEVGMCVSGAITNYTDQLTGGGSSAALAESQYNLTEALLFLSHYMGDIHQPMHVSFTSDRGGNTINVRWFTRKEVLHHVWDASIIETAEERFYDSDVEALVDEINKNITGAWADEVPKWEQCGGNKAACPDIYATESIAAACEWGYKGASEGSVLEDDYFLSRLPVVNLRLAQGGVRLAAVLNQALG